ncbi:MAG TPA: methyltransferase domain-containing protein [Ktedonobacteraceae bacterium]
MVMSFESLEPLEPRKDLASTYIVPDRFNEKEISRLQLQDKLLTSTMGGVFAEQPSLSPLERVLDIGCGTGGWLMEVAQTHPEISMLIGIDISPKILEVASKQAQECKLDKRVEFHSMDALRMLEFPNNFFDLVNQRVATSWLRTWDWPKIIQECLRVLRIDGVLRLTEVNGIVECNTPAQTYLWDLIAQALDRAGAYFNPKGGALDSILMRLLEQYGFQQIQTHMQSVEYRAGTAEGKLFTEDIKYLFRTMKPYLQKWTRLPDNYEDLYQQALAEAEQSDFVARFDLFTVWGTKLFPYTLSS